MTILEERSPLDLEGAMCQIETGRYQGALNWIKVAVGLPNSSRLLPILDKFIKSLHSLVRNDSGISWRTSRTPVVDSLAGLDTLIRLKEGGNISRLLLEIS